MRPVIFEGHDRCGKSTIANELAKRFGTEVFMTNSRQCFTSKTKPESMGNLAQFNYTIAEYVQTLQEDLDKPIIIYRSFLSEMVYSTLFKRYTSHVYNDMTDYIFSQLDAAIILCKNTDQAKFNDDETSDDDIRRSIELFDQYSKTILTDVVEIDTSDHDVEKYVNQIEKIVRGEKL